MTTPAAPGDTHHTNQHPRWPDDTPILIGQQVVYRGEDWEIDAIHDDTTVDVRSLTDIDDARMVDPGDLTRPGPRYGNLAPIPAEEEAKLTALAAVSDPNAPGHDLPGVQLMRDSLQAHDPTPAPPSTVDVLTDLHQHLTELADRAETTARKAGWGTRQILAAKADGLRVAASHIHDRIHTQEGTP